MKTKSWVPLLLQVYSRRKGSKESLLLHAVRCRTKELCRYETCPYGSQDSSSLYPTKDQVCNWPGDPGKWFYWIHFPLELYVVFHSCSFNFFVYKIVYVTYNSLCQLKLLFRYKSFKGSLILLYVSFIFWIAIIILPPGITSSVV